MTINTSPGFKSENKYMLQNKQRDKSQVSFKGMESAANYFFSQVQTNEVFGATVVDFISMIAPRTAVDMTRSPQAGIETARRESSGAVINCLIPGFVGMGIGWLLGKFINPELKVNTALPINSDTAKMLHNSWKAADGHKFYENVADKKQIVKGYVEHVLNQVEGLVGDKWVKLSDIPDAVNDFSSRAAELNINEKNLPKKEIKKGLEKIKKETVNVLGASENIRIGGEKGLVTTIDRLYCSMHGMGTEILTKANSSKEADSFVEKFLKVSPKKTAIALSVIASMGLAQQAVNRYLTKKKTGSDAFVGISEEGRQSEKQDKNSKSKLAIAKIASVTALMGIAASAIAGSIKPKDIIETFKPNNLIKKFEFNGKWPGINQLKAVYAFMVAGRMIAATDKHELRETNTRDIPGYLNWLVLGGFVSKLSFNKLTNGELLNGPKFQPDKNAGPIVNWFKKAFHVITKNSIVSHVENEAKFKQGLIDEAKKNFLNKNLSKKIAAGLVYSTLALGVFMPMLNKYITNKLTAKKKSQDKPNTGEVVSMDAILVSQKQNISSAISTPASQEVFADFIKTQQKLKKV